MVSVEELLHSIQHVKILPSAINEWIALLSHCVIATFAMDLFHHPQNSETPGSNPQSREWIRVQFPKSSKPLVGCRRLQVMMELKSKLRLWWRPPFNTDVEVVNLIVSQLFRSNQWSMPWFAGGQNSYHIHFLYNPKSCKETNVSPFLWWKVDVTFLPSQRKLKSHRCIDEQLMWKWLLWAPLLSGTSSSESGQGLTLVVVAIWHHEA